MKMLNKWFIHYKSNKLRSHGYNMYTRTLCVVIKVDQIQVNSQNSL